MSKGIRSFPKDQQAQVARRRTTWYDEDAKKRNAPRGLGFWGGKAYLDKHNKQQ